jgi:ankyrin repeat protein
MVSLLLQWREELATQLDSSQSTPLHYASSDGDCSVIQEILKHTPPSATQLQDSDGLSALHVAALMGHTTAVRLLLKFSPASADIRDNHGRTFLHVAAMRGHVSVISYAIKNRMLMHILNEQDNEGNTPLHLAVIAGEYKVISKLLYSGKVQNHIMNYAGHTPYDLAEKSTGFYTMVFASQSSIFISLFLSLKMYFQIGEYNVLSLYLPNAGKDNFETICIWSAIPTTKARPYSEMERSGHHKMASDYIKVSCNCFYSCGDNRLLGYIQHAWIIWIRWKGKSEW